MELTAEMKKSIEEMVDQKMAELTVSQESESVAKTEEIVANSTESLADPTAQATEVEKSVDKDTERESNGGKDKIKSGTPQTEKQSMMKSEEEAVEKADCKEDVKDHEDKMHKKDNKKMKKSLEELSSILSDDELEVITAWREAISAPEGNDVVAKSNSGLTENNSEIMEKLDSLSKSIGEKDDVIKSLSDKIEKLSSQPAYDKRSVDSLEPVEKSEASEPVLQKSQVLDAMLDLQKSGKGVTSVHVAEYEATGNFANPSIKNAVMNYLKSK